MSDFEGSGRELTYFSSQVLILLLLGQNIVTEFGDPQPSECHSSQNLALNWNRIE